MKARIIFGRLMAALAFLIAAVLPANAGLSGPSGIELATTLVTGSFSGTGNGTAGQFLGFFNITISGSFTGTVVIERSFDGGATYNVVPTDTIGTANAYTAPVTLALYENEPGVFYRVRCSAFSSGPINYRLSAGPRNT